jgi:hypothetical protein
MCSVNTYFGAALALLRKLLTRNKNRLRFNSVSGLPVCNKLKKHFACLGW